jgi:nitrogen fixation-related uncharacterized protein
MTLVPAAIVIVAVAVAGGALALAAFYWALRHRQFSIKQINEGAFVIFDSVEHVGKPTDVTFKKQSADTDERKHT